MASMTLVVRCALSLIVLATATCGARAQGVPADAGLSGLEILGRAAPTWVRHELEEMYRSSATFRGQCQRLGVAGDVLVRWLFDPMLPSRDVRARTEIVRRGGRVAVATVMLPPSSDLSELVAHEVEHVLEQLDGVNLARQDDRRAVWQDRAGAFETARATTVGRRVHEEVRSSARLVLVRR